MKNFEFDELWNRLPSVIRSSCDKCEQDPKYHPEGVVTEHTRLVFEYAKKNFPDYPILLVCAIFHDLGKPETQRVITKNGKQRITNYGHEKVGLKYIEKYIHLYSDVSNDKETIYNICKQHMRIHLYKNGRMTKPNKRKDLEEKTYFELLMKFSECDENGR
mgnify:CR=1 FL=1